MVSVLYLLFESDLLVTNPRGWNNLAFCRKNRPGYARNPVSPNVESRAAAKNQGPTTHWDRARTGPASSSNDEFDGRRGIRLDPSLLSATTRMSADPSSSPCKP